MRRKPTQFFSAQSAPKARRSIPPERLPILESSHDGERETYLWPDTHSPAIPHLGRIHYRRALPELPAHRHENAFEITHLREGNLSWEMDSCPLLLGPGDVLVVPPGTLHGGSWAMMQPCRLDFLQIKNSLRPSRLRPLLTPLAAIAGKPFHGTGEVAVAFDRILAEVRKTDAWSESAMESAVVLLVAAVARANIAEQNDTRNYSEPVVRVIRALETNPRRWFTIHDLAGLCGLRATQLQLRFRLETGQSINTFALDYRLSRACSLLESGTSVTDTATRLGFSSSQYFATAFKRQFGISPCGWTSC